MKQKMGKLTYNGKEYTVVFNLNVMEAIQEEYGTMEEWGALTDKDGAEPDMKAIKFGFREMLNEGIDMENEENGTDTPFLTPKQVGRLVTAVGLEEVAATMQETVIDSVKSDEKNG